MTLAEMLQLARGYVMSPAERALQALDWAYGQLGATTNHKPQRDAFRRLWTQRGLPPEDFDSWADQRQWWS